MDDAHTPAPGGDASPIAQRWTLLGVVAFCLGTGALAAAALPHVDDRAAVFSSMAACWFLLAQLISGQWRYLRLGWNQLMDAARRGQLRQRLPARVLQAGATGWAALFFWALAASWPS